MFQIPDSLIVNFSISRQVYRQGLNYFSTGKIKSVRIQEDKPIIYGVVRDSQDYNVRIVFGEDGVFQSAECTCPVSSHYSGHCKHIVAVLLHLKWLKENNGFRSFEEKKAAREFFRYFPSSSSVIRTMSAPFCLYESGRTGHMSYVISVNS